MADAEQQEQEPNESQSVNWPTSTIAALMQQVLQWFGCTVEQRVIEDFIDETRRLLNTLSELQEILTNVISLARDGLEHAILLLRRRRVEVVRVCRDSNEFLIYKEKLSKGTTSPLMKDATGYMTKTAARSTAAILAKEGAEQLVKETTKSVSWGVTIFGVKIGVFFTKEGTKQALKQSTRLAMTAATPVGMVADLAQVGCKLAGHENVGKGIGATGNAAAGAMMGAVLGPPGMAAGAVGGLVLWGFGELVGHVIEDAIPGSNDKTATNTTTESLDAASQ